MQALVLKDLEVKKEPPIAGRFLERTFEPDYCTTGAVVGLSGGLPHTGPLAL